MKLLDQKSTQRVFNNIVAKVEKLVEEYSDIAKYSSQRIELSDRSSIRITTDSIFPSCLVADLVKIANSYRNKYYGFSWYISADFDGRPYFVIYTW